ncbi:MAG TPA: hypothetical protein VH085_12900 [Nocardioides sp.]|nr:hypothetical protein [Nocardioides sp.]
MSTPASEPRYVFVVTYGRSGSTLTQGMLNALPRTLVRGENNLFLLPLFRSWHGLKGFQARFRGAGNPKTTSAFYGLHELDMDAFAASVRDLVRVQLLGSTPPDEVDRLGFKEVLWHRLKPRQWADFFDFMDLAFADPLYVLNQRDVEMASTSGFWRSRKPGVAMQQITKVRRLQEFLRESRPERCYDTRYEVTTSKDRDEAAASMKGLAEFVTGSCDDDLLERMLALRDVGHGPNPFGKARDDTPAP